jgi:hypothetical protein
VRLYSLDLLEINFYFTELGSPRRDAPAGRLYNLDLKERSAFYFSEDFFVLRGFGAFGVSTGATAALAEPRYCCAPKRVSITAPNPIEATSTTRRKPTHGTPG